MSPQLNPNEQVLMALGEALKTELTAVHQYLLHARLCQNWGYSRLAEYNRKEALEELGHAGLLIDRILFLQGVPNMTDMFPIADAGNVQSQLENALALEKEAIARLNAAVKYATEASDSASRQLFDKILQDEDHHVDYLEGQLHAIHEIGLSGYLAQQIYATAQ
jgi:bacterioferritin